MAEQPKRGTRRSDFVAKIVGDPNNPPDTTLLSGFLGDASEEAHTRLYFDATLHDYVDIPDDAIIHTEPMAREESPLGGEYVWVKADAELKYPAQSTDTSDTSKSAFFDGQIYQEYDWQGTGDAGTEKGPATAICPKPSIAIPCATQLVKCKTVAPPCKSALAPCISLQTPCVSINNPCVSVVRPCVSLTIPCTLPPQCPLKTVPPGCGPVSLLRCPSGPACVEGGGFDPGIQAAHGMGGYADYGYDADGGAEAKGPATQLCGGPSVATPCVTVVVNCRTLAPACRTATPACKTLLPPCRTLVPACRSILGPCATGVRPCPTLTTPCTHPPQCPILTGPPGCVPQTLGGCPSGPVCGGGGVIDPGIAAAHAMAGYGDYADYGTDYGYGYAAAPKGPVTQLCGQPTIAAHCVSLACPSVHVVCPSIAVACPSVHVACPTLAACPSVHNACPSELANCPSVHIACPTVAAACPSVHVVCPSVHVVCPSAHAVCTLPPQCPIRTQLPQCPVASLHGCATGAVCVEGGTTDWGEAVAHGMGGGGQAYGGYADYTGYGGAPAEYAKAATQICPITALCPATQICPPTALCPATQTCPQTALCPATQICPHTALCPATQLCPQTAICPATQICPVTASCPATQTCPHTALCPATQTCPQTALCPATQTCPHTALCPATTTCPVTAGCPATQTCPHTALCPATQTCPHTALCPATTTCPVTAVCPPTQSCPQSVVCPVSLACPSAKCR